MRISSGAARIATCGMAVGLAGGLCLALGYGSRHGRALGVEPAFAFDGTTSSSTAVLSPTDGLRGGSHPADGGEKSSALTALQYAADRATICARLIISARSPIPIRMMRWARRRPASSPTPLSRLDATIYPASP